MVRILKRGGLISEKSFSYGRCHRSGAFNDGAICGIANNIKKVTLIPFMLVAGDHANNDMAGKDEDSHKSQLEAEDFKVKTYIHGLGENKGIQDIYIDHLKQAMDEFNPAPPAGNE